MLVDPYGGASVQRVTAGLDWRSLVAQWFAEQGFAVLVADGRGTPGAAPAGTGRFTATCSGRYWRIR